MTSRRWRPAATLALPEFDDGQAWALAEGYITAVSGLAGASAAPVDRASFLTHARTAAPLLRPLTVLLLADGPAHGTVLGSGTPAHLSTLLDDHLQRLEVRFWGGVDERHRTLLCAATLFRGLPVTLLSHPWPGLEDALPYGRAYDPAHYRRLTGSPDARSQLAPLQPDLLGEYYVLDTLHRQSTGAFDLRDTLLAARREEHTQEGAIQFAHLCTRDFAAVNAPSCNRMIPAQAAASLLLAITPDSPALTLLKAIVTVNATTYYGKAQNIPQCQTLLTVLDSARTAFPDDIGLQLEWAKGAFNLILYLGTAGDIPTASALLDALNSARSAFPDDTELRLRWAEGAFTLINALGTAGDIPAAAALLDALDSTRTAFPDDTELRLAWAKGTFNLNAALGTAGDIPAAAALLDALDNARTAFPDDAELQLAWAQGAVNLIAYLGTAGDIPAAAALLDALDTARIAVPGDAEPRLRWAKGAVNLAIAYAKAGDIPEALTRLDAVLSTSGLPEEFLAQIQGIRQKILALLTQNA